MTKNILIIKLSAIGDVIHALPTAAAIKETWPNSHITWVVSPVALDIVRNSPAIDDIIVFERKKLNSLSSFLKYIKPFSAQLNKRHYDICIDLQGLLKSAVIAFLSHADKKIGYVNMREGSGFISKAVKGPNYNGHIVERYLDTVRYLGCAPQNIDFPLGITNTDTHNAQQILFANNILPTNKYLTLVIGANWSNKRWPTKYFSQIVDWCNTNDIVPILTGAGSIDKNLAKLIQDTAQTKAVNLVNSTSLKELAYIIKNSVAVIGGDTGNLHIAAALKTPAIMIMGPTDANRNGLYQQTQNVLEVPYECKHCWKRKCKFNRDCLSIIKPDMVIQKLQTIINLSK
ncbi:lipopolysaccharide heptosyltransferase I [Pectinatus brassicae]|uniref:Lipopolysaccharide heptosyltransferase 1 n=1 Tax=Pectinatus brassicae TaxID=862415 RepID=A0A840UIC5_9FIRM|nr:lipopolysaccharide heptosyltransferase I [Pectinatus brassicae]MBB5335930.1 heptosyltransferase-1 [Pectinatus brassicae]